MQEKYIGILDTKSKAVLFLALITPLIAWSGVFDDYAHRYIDQSLEQAGIAYASARGINAIVSVAQTVHVDMLFIEATPGEALDPLNDLIERFSALMLAAFASLALQKILLELVSSTFFNWTFTALAIAASIALIRKNQVFSTQIWRIFLIAFFLRFALSIVLLASFWVDSAFLLENDGHRITQLKQYETEISTLSEKSLSVAAARERKESQEEAVASAEKALALKERELKKLGLVVEEKSDNLDNSRKGQTLCQGLLTSVNCSEDVMAEKAVLDRARKDYKSQEDIVSQAQNAVSEANKELACSTKKASGKSCSMLPSFRETQASLTNNIGHVNEKLTDFADNIISILMSFILKTILIPLLFLHLLLKAAGRSWAILPNAMRADETFLSKPTSDSNTEPNRSKTNAIDPSSQLQP